MSNENGDVSGCYVDDDDSVVDQWLRNVNVSG